MNAMRDASTLSERNRASALATIIRAAVLKDYPQIALIVRPLMESFDTATLQQLNQRVQINGESDAAVAAEYLKGRGFLK